MTRSRARINLRNQINYRNSCGGQHFVINDYFDRLIDYRSNFYDFMENFNIDLECWLYMMLPTNWAFMAGLSHIPATLGG